LDQKSPRPDAQDFERQRPFPAQKHPDETILRPYVVILKQSGNVVTAITSGGRVMSTIENDGAGSESWDPALWSIGTVLGAAIVYLACLT
jgi:hypothetical protein